MTVHNRHSAASAHFTELNVKPETVLISSKDMPHLLVTALIRIPVLLLTPLHRLQRAASRWINYFRSALRIKGLHSSVQFDGVPLVTGSARISIGHSSRIGMLCELGTEENGHIRIGRSVRINRGTTVFSYSDVEIGDHSLIGEFVTIRDANHGISRGQLIRSQKHSSSPIRIGRDVWIGRGACILPGVEIGDGAVIGANSVVTRSIPAGSIAAGVPAKVIRER